MIPCYREQVASDHALHVLEFDAVRQVLGRCMSSELGRARLSSVVPVADPPLIRLKQRQTSEAKALLLEAPPPSLQQVIDPRPLLDQVAQQGKIFEPQELLDCQILLLTARQTKRAFGQVAVRYPLLAALTEPMVVPEGLEQRIGQVVDARGDIKDQASARLQEVRTELRQTRERIRKRLDWHLMHHKEVVQEPLITLRNNRYVIPLKLDYQRLLRGIVHDHSTSGATVFVEPLDVLDLNNRLVELATAEDAEVHRILRELTTEIWGLQGPIRQIAEILGEVDLVFARAHLSLRWRCHEASFGDDDRLDLVQAYHPLLLETAGGRNEGVVPATLAVEAGTQTLVITGPNTGGKTVLLKTVGLLTLMAQAGLHIPSAAGSRLRLFARVFVDIGDEQSIAQSLSTFSGHMQHIVNFLQEADARALVLLDELGAGTDPAEGAALGLAILEHLAHRGAKTLVTTHHQAIKLHAHAHPVMDTAVMEFDAETLQPTFHVRLGQFGGSNAFAISRRLGMPAELLALAQSFLDTDQHRLTEVTDRLQEELRQVERLRREAEQDRQAAAAARARYEEKLAESAAEHRRVLTEAAAEVGRWLDDTKMRLEEALQHLRRQGIRPDVEPSRALVREVETRLEQHALQASPAERELRSLNAGDAVWLPKWQVRGVVLKWPESGDLVEVQAGQMTLKVPASQVEPLAEPAASRSTRRVSWHSTRTQTDPAIRSELNLIGWRVPDALPYLDKYLDDAVAAGLHRVRIIHGKGSGRLRAAVHELLTSHPLVKTFMPCGPNDGGWGATLVEMDV
jgi:DNA mismatch repair protein MutS2